MHETVIGIFYLSCLKEKIYCMLPQTQFSTEAQKPRKIIRNEMNLQLPDMKSR